ncbi:MAG TPA: amidohydrolase family protein [Thermoanaerobaculia bacterium]|jgi:N-acyl-D-amino-acid deacylase
MRAVLAAVLAVALVAAAVAYVRAPRYDVVVADATIVDGTGAAPFAGGIGIDGERIAAVWRGSRRLVRARRRRIDGHGLVLAPGFIDTHTHADRSIGERRWPVRGDNFVSQGVTTIVTGNCGIAPQDIGAFRELVTRRGSNVNIGVLTGWNSLREEAVGDAPALTDADLRLMQTLAERDLRAGALGISTGLEYGYGRTATARELVPLLRVAARYGGVHATHLRNEASEVVDAAAEVITMSDEARVPLLISHLKVEGPNNCGLVTRLEETVRGRARVDQYPYAASSTRLEIYFPAWFAAAPEAEQRKMLRERRAELKAAIAARLHRDGFADFGFARVARFRPRRDWSGLTLREIAGRSLDAQLEVALRMVEDGDVQMVYQNICAGDVERIARALHPMIGSDSTIRYEDNSILPHPRGWGTFAEFLGHFVRELHVDTLPAAIHRMTDEPARFFGLRARGRIAPGWFADVVLFDPRTIAARATYSDPYARPDGIACVLVNGRVVVNGGEVTGAVPGRFVGREPRGPYNPPR